MDLSTGYPVNSLTCSHTEAMDLVKKPEWYRRHAAACSTDRTSPTRPRSRTSFPRGFVSAQTMDINKPDGGVAAPLCHGDTEHGGKSQGGMYTYSAVPEGLGLYHEGVCGNRWRAGFYQPDPAESAAAESSSGTDSDSGSDVIFLVSATKDSLPCSSLSGGESASPAAECLSPAALSLDEEGRCFLLPPRTPSSQSPESSFSEDSSDSSSVIPVHHARPVVLLSDVKIDCRSFAESPIDISSDDDDSAVIEVSVSDKNRKRGGFDDSCSDKESVASKWGAQNQCGNLRRSARIKMAALVEPELACRDSHHNLRSNGNVGVYSEWEVMDYRERPFSSEEEEEVDKEDSPSQPSLTRKSSCSSDGSNMADWSSGWRRSKSARRERPHVETARHPTPQIVKEAVTSSRNAGWTEQQKPAESQPRAAGAKKTVRRKPARSKTAGGKRRRRKKKRPQQGGPPGVFPPGEEDILFRYTKPKGREKKKSKSDDFRPFVHVERRSCVVVNYQEDEESVGRSRLTEMPGCLPRTSCFRLGRLGSGCGRQPTQTCCLCGQSANAMGLGDLHGPYHPVTRLPLCQAQRHRPQRNGVDPPPPNEAHGVKAEPGQASACSGQGWTTVKAETTVSRGDREPEDGGDGSSVVASVTDGGGVDGGGTPAASPPCHADEHWVHEDCGVWSPGVYLVKGRLYGLKEAANLGKETVCSGCNESGAIMGCFQKGCTLNYHYRCAIRAGCVLNEENFSMKCSNHKNKAFHSVTHRHKR